MKVPYSNGRKKAETIKVILPLSEKQQIFSAVSFIAKENEELWSEQ